MFGYARLENKILVNMIGIKILAIYNLLGFLSPKPLRDGITLAKINVLLTR